MGTNFNRFMIGLLSAFSLLLLSSVVGRFWLSRLADETHAMQQQAAQFEHKSDELKTLVSEARSSVRGYLLTGNPDMLNAFHSAQHTVPVLLTSLDERHVLGFDDAWKDLELHLAAEVDFHRLGRGDISLQLVQTDHVQQYFDNLFFALNTYQTFQQKQLQEAFVREDSIRAYEHVVIGLSFLLSLVLIALLGWKYRQNIGLPLQQLIRKLNMHPSNLAKALGNVQVKEPQLAKLRDAVIFQHDEVIALKNQRLAQEIEKTRAQEEFSAVLAHELRTPLTTLMGLADLTKVESYYTAEQVLRDSRAVAASLLDLVNSTLDYQRIKLGQFEPKISNVSPVELVQSALTSAIPQDTDRVVQAFTAIEPNCLVQADSIKIRQVLINLLGNAVKFSDSGSYIKVRTYLHGQGPQRQLVFEVEDNGDGISAENQERVFEAFTQVSSGTRRKHNGTGLGLALSREIAQALGGDLTVKSRLGVGSTFTLTVPVTMAEAQDEKVTSASEDAGCAVDFHNKRFLMVEDHVLNCEVYQHILESGLGVHVEAVHTAEEALERFENGERFDLILMDINLGAGMDGLEATKQLKIRYAKECPPVIAISAGLEDLNSAKIKEAGLDCALGKPFDLQQLATMASRCINLRMAA